jgi:hypothetical protein
MKDKFQRKNKINLKKRKIKARDERNDGENTRENQR